MTKTNWAPIKEAYQRGEGSCRELAEKFGVSFIAIRNRCNREGWKSEMVKIGEKVTQKVVESLAQRGVAHAERMLKRYDNWLCKIDKVMPLAMKKIKEASLRDLVTSQTQLDQAARKAYGLDQRELESQGAVIPIGGLELQAKMLEQIYAIKALVKEGKIKTIDIDPDEVAKMKIIRGS